MHKQVILARKDLKMSVGKLAAQVGHAVERCVRGAYHEELRRWDLANTPKIVLRVNSEDELFRLIYRAQEVGMTTSIIQDAAHTFFKAPTYTVGGIGPHDSDQIDKIVGHLSLY